MRRIMHIVSILVLVTATSYLTGCETDEDNAIAQAQDCFNNLRDGASDAQVDVCLAKIANINSAEANTLKCGMAMFKGDINTGTITGAFDAMDAAPESDKESILLDALVIGTGQPAEVTEAEVAYNYCSAAGSPGLLYLATLVRTATVMESVASGGDGSPAQIIADCNLSATCETTIGEMIVEMADQYCIGESADSDVCQAALAAIAAGGSFQNIGEQFLNQIDP